MLDTVISAGAGGLGGFVLGASMCWYYIGNKSADLDTVKEYMNRVVNAEESEERYNLTRKMMHDAKRRTMPRSDAGAPARVHTVKKRRVERGRSDRLT